MRGARVLVTGADGYVGRRVVRAVLEEGHQVSGVVRSAAAARRVAVLGATPLLGDVADLLGRGDLWDAHDVFVHLAATAPEVEHRVVDAVERWLGVDRRWVHTTGIWMYGPSPGLVESTAFRPPDVAAWRVDVVHRLRRIGERQDVRIVAPAVVHGDGRCASLDRVLSGAHVVGTTSVIRTIGSGRQHWPTVHVADLARLYALLVSTARSEREVIGASGHNPTVRALASALGRRTGMRHELMTESGPQAVVRLGPFAEAALLDQRAAGTQARLLGWHPVEQRLLAEIEDGVYDEALLRALDQAAGT